MWLTFYSISLKQVNHAAPINSNISFVTITCFGSVCHHKEYEGHEVFFRRRQTKGLKRRFFFLLP